MWAYGQDQAGFVYGRVAGNFECRNEPSGSVKRGKLLD